MSGFELCIVAGIVWYGAVAAHGLRVYRIAREDGRSYSFTWNVLTGPSVIYQD